MSLLNGISTSKVPQGWESVSLGVGQDGFISDNDLTLATGWNPGDWSKLTGFQGSATLDDRGQFGMEGGSVYTNPELIQHLNSKGFTVAKRDLPNGYIEQRLFDPSGKPIGNPLVVRNNDRGALGDILKVGAIAAGGAWANGAFGGAAGGAGGGSGVVSGGTGISAGGGATGGLTAAGAGTGSGLTVGAGGSGIGAGIGGSIGAGGAAGGGLTLGQGLNIGRTLLTLGGAAGAGAAAGGGSVDTADRTKLAGLAGDAGADLFGFAKDYLTNAAKRGAATDKSFDTLIAGLLEAQQKGADRGDVAWDAFVNDFLPAGQEFAQRAMNYDTPGRRAQAVAEARAGVATEAAAQRQAQKRMLGRSGVQLSGGRALTLDNASRFAETKASTGAARGAARDVETTGLKLLADAGQMGIPIAGIAGQQSGQGIAAGGAAGSAVGAKESVYGSTLNPALSLYQAGTGMVGTAGNILNGVAATQAQNRAADSAGYAGLGSFLGQIATADSDSIIGKWLGGN